jgi:mRNA-degrading endonuclease toxin of MazEF toxin-antitoxin module
VVVVSHDAFNAVPTWRSVIVVPCTTSERQGSRGPTAVLLPAGAGGLPKPGIALCHQITTLDRSKPTRRIGHLSETEIQAIEVGIRAAVDLES